MHKKFDYITELGRAACSFAMAQGSYMNPALFAEPRASRR